MAVTAISELCKILHQTCEKFGRKEAFKVEAIGLLGGFFGSTNDFSVMGFNTAFNDPCC